jgi:glycosyltransferase involved in cell wall biosynthesis
MLAPPMLPVPPPTYAGTERVIAALIDELVRRGHRVTLFGPGDSTVDCEIVATPPRSLWSQGHGADVSSFISITLARAWQRAEDFDLLHSHVETLGFLFARHCPRPVVTTLHGRLDTAGIPSLLQEFRDIPLVAISDSQGRWWPDLNWTSTIHHGLPLQQMPFSTEPGDYLAFVGRVTPEKGIPDSIALARRTGLRLRIAAKVYDPHEKEHYKRVVAPAIEEGVVEFLGELGEPERDALYAGALATLMLGAWPEPFGLVAIESMAAGTPVIARRAGALTETVEHGVDGFLVDDLSEAELAVSRVAGLRRDLIRQRAVERFSPERMADEYEAVYAQLLSTERGTRPTDGARPDPRSVEVAGARG